MVTRKENRQPLIRFAVSVTVTDRMPREFRSLGLQDVAWKVGNNLFHRAYKPRFWASFWGNTGCFVGYNDDLYRVLEHGFLADKDPARPELTLRTFERAQEPVSRSVLSECSLFLYRKVNTVSHYLPPSPICDPPEIK